MSKNIEEKKEINTSSDEDEDDFEQLQYKVTVMGDGAVGKTSIIQRFCNDIFAKQYKQTIGLDFFLKELVLPGNIHVQLKIWDIGGQSVGSPMIGNYIFGSQAVVFVYDISNFQSFQNVEDWYKLCQKTFDKASQPYMAIIGNKTDLAHLRTVSVKKHETFAEENDFVPFFVSAKTGDGINAVFTKIAADIANVILTRNELEGVMNVVKAEIVDHPQNDPNTESPKLVQSKKCSIQ